jgi:hypothetical protein
LKPAPTNMLEQYLNSKKAIMAGLAIA